MAFRSPTFVLSPAFGGRALEGCSRRFSEKSLTDKSCGIVCIKEAPHTWSASVLEGRPRGYILSSTRCSKRLGQVRTVASQRLIRSLSPSYKYLYEGYVIMSLGAFGVEVGSYEIVGSYPHDPTAFTQGLVYAEEPIHIPSDIECDLLRTSREVFYESTGLVRESSLRCAHKETGRILRRVSVPTPHFGEGLAFVPHPQPLFFQLTWLTRTAFAYDGRSLKLLRQMEFDGEGWGATYDPLRNCIYTSGGTDRIRILDAQTFQVLNIVQVRVPGQQKWENNGHLWYLNDMEMVPDSDELWCNIFLSDYIAVVDVTTWTLKRWIDLDGLLQPEHQLVGHEVDVLNGLAWDARRQCMYVTGKRWPRVYAIRERRSRAT